MKSAILIFIFMQASVLGDGLATRKVIERGGVETNPLARPFVYSTPGLIMASEVAIAPLSYMLLKRPRSKKWKIAALALTGVEIYMTVRGARMAAGMPPQQQRAASMLTWTPQRRGNP